MLKVMPRWADTRDMKIFKRNSAAEKREDEAQNDLFNDRMRSVLSRETKHDDAAKVESRLRNMAYGTNKE